MNSLAKHIIAVEQRILNPEKPELASMPGEPLNIPIEVIENILRSGGSHPFSDEHIIIGLSEKKTDEQKADFLREEFGIGARGIFFGETRYAAFFDESGITVSQGMRAFSDHELHISWQEAAERTELMLDVGSFASPEVILHVPTRMREELAREIIAQQRQFGGNYFVEPHYFAGTETQTIQLLSRSLEDAAFIRELTERLQNPRRADQAEIFIPKLETAMFALSVELTTREGFAPVYKQFVTDDEKQLRMTELADSGQFDDFYGKDHTMTEKAEYLKSSLGTRSRTGMGWNMEYSTDGIRYAKTGKKSTVLATAHISWSDAAAMIEGRMSARIAEIQSIRNDADYYNAQLIADLREGDLITFGGMTYKVREIIGDYMCTIEPRNPDGSLIPGISEAYQTLSGNWRENLLGLAGSERILREEPVSRTYLIFQMKKDEALHYYRFEPLDSLKKQHFPVDFSNYDHVYSGDLNDIAGSSLRSKLDMIYQKFNLDHPADFTGHSLSVGDIIVVTEAGQETAYFVDSVSFVSVPEFLASRDAAISETATKDKIASDGISETDDLKAGDHIRFDGKEWVVESIDGDFYISLQNLDPKDNMQKRGMTNWKKHLPDIEKIEGFGIPRSHKTSESSKPNGRSEAEGQLGLFDFTDTDETPTERVDTSINSEDVTASEMTESAPVAVDESAADAQHTEVLAPAPALTLEKELYRSISEKFPKVLNGEHTYEQYGAPDDGTDIEPLSIKARGGNVFELTVFSMQDNIPMNDPQYVFTVNTVSGTVQALEYRLDGDSADTSINESVILPDGTVDYALQLSIERAMRQTLLQMDVLNRPLRMYSDSEGMHTVSVLSGEEAEAEVTAPVSYDENAHLRGILNEFSAKHGLGALDVSHDHDRVYRLNEVFADGEEFTLAWIYGDYYAPVLPEETLKRELENLEGDCARRGEPVDEMRGRKAQAEAHGGITPLPAAPDELPEIRYADNPQQRIYANLSALRELARLERAAKAGRPLYDERPTQYHSKQNSDRTLREYVGWGGLPQVFDESFDNLGHIRGQLRELMTPEEYENARASTLTAFYTPQVVIDAMYKALRQMDLPRDCRILEPACGTGNFITRMPHSLGSGGVVGIELDSVTARIATYLASGRENVTIRNCGFEESGLANDSFDLAIGNIPFGEFKLRDPDYAKDWLIHDAFFRKALDKVAPGGVVAFITSSGTLGIPTMLDRIIQQCMKIILEPICEAKFYPHSYGFRPYRAQKHAIRDIVNVVNATGIRKDKAVWAIEGDIKGYFDTINHRILMRKLWKIGIHDKRVLKIISQMLKAGYIEHGLYHMTTTGTPQGGILSPLLANVYLNDFDWYVGRKYLEPHRKCLRKSNDTRRMKAHGATPKYNFRYADDWVILTTSKEEAERLKRELTKYFKYQLKLELSQEKTYVTDLRDKGIRFLGFVVIAERKRKTPDPKTWTDNLVGKPYPDLDRLKRKTDKIKEAIRSIQTYEAHAGSDSVSENLPCIRSASALQALRVVNRPVP